MKNEKLPSLKEVKAEIIRHTAGLLDELSDRSYLANEEDAREDLFRAVKRYVRWIETGVVDDIYEWVVEVMLQKKEKEEDDE